MQRRILCGFFALATSLGAGSANAAPVGPGQAELDQAATASTFFGGGSETTKLIVMALP